MTPVKTVRVLFCLKAEDYLLAMQVYLLESVYGRRKWINEYL